jgi:hypothetical protein
VVVNIFTLLLAFLDQAGQLTSRHGLFLVYFPVLAIHACYSVPCKSSQDPVSKYQAQPLADDMGISITFIVLMALPLAIHILQKVISESQNKENLEAHVMVM